MAQRAQSARRLRRARSGGVSCSRPTQRLMLRGAKPCVRYVGAGRLRDRAAVGDSSFRFTGRVQRRWLKPGRYRLRAQAIDPAGNRSLARFARFVVARR